MKEQDKVPKEELSGMEIVNITDKEYKVMDEQNEKLGDFNKEKI